MHTKQLTLLLVAVGASSAFSLLQPSSTSGGGGVSVRKPLGPRSAAALSGGATSSKSSVTQSTLNLAKNIVGAGVLSLPAGVAAYSTAKGAAAPACGLIALLGAVSAYCFALVGRACAATGTTTYRGAWEAVVDAKSGNLITGICSFKTLVGCVSYAIIMGDTSTALATSANLPALLCRRDVMLSILGAGVLFPLSMLKDMKSLAPTSVLGLAGMLYTAVVVALRYAQGAYASGGRFVAQLAKDGQKLPSFGTGRSPGGALLLVSMLATSFIAHYNAANFYVELENPTIERYGRVTAGGFGIAVAFFCVMAAAGHSMFGGASAGFILNSFASTDALANAARALVGIAVACTYPLLFNNARQGFFEVLGSSPAEAEGLRAPVTAGLVALTVAAGVKITDLGFVVAFGGAILGSMIIYVLPTQIVLSADKKNKMHLSATERIACRAVNAMGFVLAGLGGTASVLNRMGRL